MFFFGGGGGGVHGHATSPWTIKHTNVRGRYHHIDRNNRICSLCNMNILEDEYHFVLVCPFYSTIGDKYIKPYYYNTPSTFKLTQLMSTDSSKHLIKLCKYLTTATMHRSDNIVTWLLLTSNIINITNITHLLLTFVLLKLLYLPFPAMCTLFYLFIYYIYVCLQNVIFLAPIHTMGPPFDFCTPFIAMPSSCPSPQMKVYPPLWLPPNKDSVTPLLETRSFSAILSVLQSTIAAKMFLNFWHHAMLSSVTYNYKIMQTHL